MSTGDVSRGSLPWEEEQETPTCNIAGRLPDGLNGGGTTQYWQSVQALEDLVGSTCEFDRRTFEPHGQTLSVTLHGLLMHLRDPEYLRRDLLLRVAPLLRRACEKIVESPNTKLARRYEEVALHKIRSQDTRCLMRLATRPGRTVLEKTARTKKAPAVVRYRSVDTPENRLVRRVVEESSRALKARKEAEAAAGRMDLWSGEEDLDALEALGRRILDDSPIGELPPMVVVEPNNTLLGDPRYNTVFRVFRAFRSRQEEFDRAWKQGVKRLGSAVAWAIRAELSAVEGVVATEAYLKPHLLGSDAERERDFFEFSVGESWFFATGEDPVVIRVDVDENVVSICHRRLGGEGLLRASGEEESWRLTIEPGASSADDGTGGANDVRGSKERGYPIEVFCASSPAEEIAIMEGSADRSGIGEVARWVLGQAGLKTREELSPSDDERQAYERLGVEFLGPRSRCFSKGQVEESGLILAAVGEEGDERVILAGQGAARALSADPNLWRKYSAEQLSQLLGYGAGDDDDEEGDSQAALRALRRAVEAGLQGVLSTGTDLAIATPDDLDEVGAQRLRGLLPTTHGQRWLVWRSVAAALALRNEVGDEVCEGDVVLVVDADAPRCTATILIGRREVCENDESGGEDSWYWERVAPFVVNGGERMTRAAWQREVAEAMVEGILDESLKKEVVQRLVDEGHVMDSVPDDAVEFPIFVEESPALVRIRLQEKHHLRAREAWLAGLSSWVEEFSKQGGAELLQKRVEREGGALRVLLVGKQFRDAQSGEAARERIDDLFTNTKIYVPRKEGSRVLEGCEVFLDRMCRGLPTWRDLIPELKLCVGRGMTKQDVYLLDPEDIKGGVRPGQMLSHEPSERFVLPAEAKVIDFPMLSGTDEDGRGGEEYTALVQDASLPLDEPVEVKLRVAYRYAEDAFRIFISPSEVSASKPFEEIKVEWRRGRSELEEDAREVKDEPPAFPSAQPWSEVNPLLLNELRGAVSTCDEKLELFNNKSKLNSRLKKNPQEVKRDLEATLDALNGGFDTMVPCLKEIVPVGRTLEKPPSEVEKVVKDANDLLAMLVRYPGGKTKKTFPHRQLGKCKDSGVEKAYRDLKEEALAAHGALRHLSVRRVLKKLRQDLEGEDLSEHQAQRRFETLGRVIGDLEDKESRETLMWLVGRFLRLLDESLEKDEPDPALRHHLWALATALWSNVGAVHHLGDERAEELCEGALRLAAKLSDEWLEAGVSIEIFKELGLVTLALLRLRGTSVGHLVEANNEYCQEMARLMEAIDEGRKFEASARIKVDGEDVEEFGTLVADNLRGFTISRIQIIEE